MSRVSRALLHSAQYSPFRMIFLALLSITVGCYGFEIKCQLGLRRIKNARLHPNTTYISTWTHALSEEEITNMIMHQNIVENYKWKLPVNRLFFLSYCEFYAEGAELFGWSDGLVKTQAEVTVLQVHCTDLIHWSMLETKLPLSGLLGLKVLSIQCFINRLSDTFFEGLTSLVYLDLSFNDITHIRKETFQTLPQLRYVLLGHNPLINFNFCLLSPLSLNLVLLDVNVMSAQNHFNTSKCSGVYYDMVSHFGYVQNTFDYIPNFAFDIFPNLKMLIITMTNTKSLYIHTYAFWGLHKLKYLILNDNEINQPNIPQLLQNHTRLSYLSLNSNRLHSIQGGFGKSIVIINLRNNRLEAINDYMLSKCVRLNNLDLSGNLLSTITSDMLKSQFTLLSLDLSNNRLNLLESGCFRNLLFIGDINLSKNNLSVLKTDNFFPNRFDSISKYLKAYLHYQPTLYNNVTLLAMFQLASLNLGHNRLSDVTTGVFDYLTGLKTLLLNNNNIKYIHKHLFTKLTRLKVLDLSSNRIVVIEPELFHNLPLTQLNISANKLTNLPCPMLSQKSSMNCSATIKILDLGHNRLVNEALCVMHTSVCPSRLHNHLIHLETLSLSDNCLTFINASALYLLPALQNFKFAGNRLKCSCDLVPFSVWILSHKNVVNDTSSKCVDAYGTIRVLIDLPDDLDCVVTVADIKVVVALSGCVGGLIVIVSLLVYFRLEISVLIYAKTGRRLHRYNRAHNDRNYQVMIYNCQEENEFVFKQLRPVLLLSFAVFWPQIDILLGQDEMTSIETGMKSCQRVLVLLTRSFATDNLCVHIFNILHNLVVENEASVVVVVADAEVIKYKKLLPERLRSYIKVRRYIHLKDRLFWQKLFFKLPAASKSQPVLGNMIRPVLNYTQQLSFVDMMDEKNLSEETNQEVAIDDVTLV